MTFLALILLQACHSVEEYAFGLYRVLAPARFASGLVSSDVATGFAILNAGLVALGLWCYFGPVRRGWPSARAWMWPWVVVEIGNGVGHPALALGAGGYFPGVATAPFLLVVASYLGVQLVRARAAGRTAA